MARMRKINDDDLLKLIDSDTSRQDIADRFNCSLAAISKRLVKLRPKPHEPLKIDDLTHKERSFVIALASGQSQTNAALTAYDVSSRDSAKSLGCTLIKNLQIKEALEEIRDREIPIDHLIRRLRQHVDSSDPSASLRAVDMGLKLHGAYPPEKKVNLNADIQFDPVDLSQYANYSARK